MSKCILLIFAIVLVFMVGVTVYKLVSREKYMRLKDLGIARMALNYNRIPTMSRDGHKYSGHRYKQRKR